MRNARRRVATLAALTITLTTVSSAAVLGTASAQDAGTPEPESFTSMFSAMATPDLVVNNDGAPTPGEEGATGTFHYRINSAEEVICYDITLDGVTPPYQSPARTATHIHQGGAGNAGPPRIALPNPEDDGNGTLRSEGCLQGPFTTGVVVDGQDTGTGFSLAEIEADPAAFFTDTHTEAFTAGAVRGQLMRMPMGGVATGAGATAGGSGTTSDGAAALGVALAAGVVAAGVAVRRKRAAH